MEASPSSEEPDKPFVDDDSSHSRARAPVTMPKGVQEIPAGSTVGSYVVERLIDLGGGGVVYMARHRILGRRGALKVLREDVATPAMFERFIREASAVSRIRHPNVVEIYEFGEISPGRPYYVMELLEGTDVRKILRTQGRLSPPDMFRIFEPVCMAVQAAHDTGIVHRDIKASNVVLLERNGAQVVKLVDFGIAKPIGGTGKGGLTEPGTIVGTPHSLAPEQIRGEPLDPRTDVYALGVLAFQMLTAEYPFTGSDPMQIAMKHLQAPVPRPSDFAPVAPALDAVVVRCLEKAKERRFASAAELLAAFRAAVGHAEEASAATAEWGIGIYFEVATPADAELDEDVLVDVGAVMDTIEQGLASSGCVFPFRTSNAILGVRILDSRGQAYEAKEEMAASLQEWDAILADRPERHPAVEVMASLTVGQALCRRNAGGTDVVGGSLLDFTDWRDEERVRIG
jgi:serine/threonine-protein kinase